MTLHLRAPRSLKTIRNRLWMLPWYPRELVYHGYTLRYPEVQYRFGWGRRHYVNRVSLEAFPVSDVERVDPAVLDRVLGHVGLAFVPFMALLGNFRTVVVEPPHDPHASAFFEEYYRKGLGEFRYRHALDPSEPIAVRSVNPGRLDPLLIDPSRKALVLNGGGKESVVALELLKMMGVPLASFTANPNRVSSAVANIAGVEEVPGVRWRTDPAIERDKRYKWGHFPFGALWAFMGLIPAAVYRFRYIVVGNEYSANFGNLRYRGMEINHQHTKSFEFEAAFADYVNRYMLADVSYFSVVRPLYEVKLSSLFARFPQYFGAFMSCNSGRSTGWCRKCPKCAFVFLVLYPFLSDGGVVQIFGEDLMERVVIRKHLLQMASGGEKPFECVGTVEESQLALHLALRRGATMAFRGRPSRAELEACCRGLDVRQAIAEHLQSFKSPHRIPADLVPALRAAIGRLSERPRGAHAESLLEL